MEFFIKVTKNELIVSDFNEGITSSHGSFYSAINSVIETTQKHLSPDVKKKFKVDEVELKRKNSARDIYAQIAIKFDAYFRCLESGNVEWAEKHYIAIDSLMVYFPTGSGFDNGTLFDWDESTKEKLVFYTSYHFMTDGSYDGEEDYKIIVKPSFNGGFDIKVKGKNRNDIKEYIAECFSNIGD